ncbi:PD-(D/E)XK nuclease family protein [bacterium]|nr:PD-(D/E)XK nuclease family protein [bacterium]MBU1616112.1 PD-(D/E)XK nuclease family protein [bacterium]
MLFDKEDPEAQRVPITCPYCNGTKIIRRGQRTKKYGEVQIFYCKGCERKFTPGISKHRTFPLRLILDALTLYNRLYSLEDSAKLVFEKYGIEISRHALTKWLTDYRGYLPFLRMREYVEKKYDRRKMLEELRLFHGQIYDFKYHRAKIDLLLEESFKNYRFRPLREFLELVIAECPHQIFKESQKRASDYKEIFDLDTVKIIPKINTASKITRFVIQAVANNKLRHEILQEFMLVNDSVTVATEVPVLLDYEDVSHFRHQLNFHVPLELAEGEVITGHIDLVQIRNGAIHILDYKPSAKKAKPIEQLTIYALALSRLTTLRLFHFKCAWFDEEDYFEFFPLHVVYKKKSRRNKRKR